MNTVHPAIARRIGPDMTSLIEDVRLSGEAWMKAKADTEKKRQWRKIRFAELREHFRKALTDAGQKVTESRLDDLAIRHDDYKAAVDDEHNAAMEEAEAEALHFAKRNSLDALIEQMRQDRTEMKFHQNAP